MSESINEECKELELEEITDGGYVTEPTHRQLQMLLDNPQIMKNKLAIDIVLIFLKKVITTNNLSFDPKTLDKISDEYKLQKSKHKPTDSTNPHKYPFDFPSFQKQIHNKTINKHTEISQSLLNKESQQINQEISYENNEQQSLHNISKMDAIKINNEIDIDDDIDSDASVELDEVVNMHYSQVSCPLTLLLCMPNPAINTEMSLSICDQLKRKIDSKEQCKHLSGSVKSSAQSAADAIQQQLHLSCEQMYPLRKQLEQYYDIILYPQKIIQCTLAVFIATVIKSLVYDENDSECNVWESLYYLFEFMKQKGNNLEIILLSFDKSKLASCLSQLVADLFSIVNVNTLELVLDSWVQQYMAYKAIEFTKQSIQKATEVWIDRKVTNNLMKKEYILQYFDDVSDLFHNINYTIKMQQIDCSYRTYKNNIGCKSLQLTIYCSRMMRNGHRMYIVATYDGKFQMKGLFSAKDINKLYGIQELTDLPMDLMQRRADKLLYGYVRSLIGSKMLAESIFGEIIRECQEFFSYNEYQDKQYCKQNICLSPTEIPILKSTHFEKSKQNVSIFQEDVHQSIENAIYSDDDKCTCFPVIWVDEEMDTYHRDDVLAVNISNDEWIGIFIGNNEYCCNWSIIRRQAKLYDISFDIHMFKEWKNNIKKLEIKPRKEGKILSYDYRAKFGRIECDGIEYKFSGKENNIICDDWYIYGGMPVYFYDGRKKNRAINIKPINKEGIISYWDPENKYGYIECGNAKFKFNTKDCLIKNDSYLTDKPPMPVYFCEGRKLENAVNNKAINVKPISKKYDKL